MLSRSVRWLCRGRRIRRPVGDVNSADGDVWNGRRRSDWRVLRMNHAASDHGAVWSVIVSLSAPSRQRIRAPSLPLVPSAEQSIQPQSPSANAGKPPPTKYAAEPRIAGLTGPPFRNIQPHTPDSIRLDRAGRPNLPIIGSPQWQMFDRNSGFPGVRHICNVLSNVLPPHHRCEICVLSALILAGHPPIGCNRPDPSASPRSLMNS